MKKYTLKGFDKCYTVYGDAQNEANRLNRKGEIPLGFESDEEAEAYRTGQWDSYFKNTFRPFETDADAVVYADGSIDERTGKGGYGIVIFFRNGEVLCESALLEDVAPETYKVTRYDRNGEINGEPVIRHYVDLFKGEEVEDKKHSFVQASHQDGGESEGARRALEICCEERNLKKIVLIYDCNFIEQRCKKGRKGAATNVPYAFGAFCEELDKEYKPEIEFIKVDSHTDKKNKAQYLVGSEKYPHAVYNDIVDTLAKAEMVGNPIGRAENFNMVRAIPDEFETFKEVEAKSSPGGKAQARRMHARKLFEIVLNEKKIRPVFTN